MRPAVFLLLVVLAIVLADAALVGLKISRQRRQHDGLGDRLAVTNALGLTDLALATEARYTRHPAVSDPMAPFMDHPGALEHFPSGSFFAPCGRDTFRNP